MKTTFSCSVFGGADRPHSDAHDTLHRTATARSVLNVPLTPRRLDPIPGPHPPTTLHPFHLLDSSSCCCCLRAAEHPRTNRPGSRPAIFRADPVTPPQLSLWAASIFVTLAPDPAQAPPYSGNPSARPPPPPAPDKAPAHFPRSPLLPQNCANLLLLQTQHSIPLASIAEDETRTWNPRRHRARTAMDVRHGADAKEPTSPAPVGLQRSRSTSTGLAGLRSLSRRITHKADPSGGNGNVMSFGAILSRTCSSVAYRHGGLPGDEGLPRGLDGDGQGYSSHVLSPAAAMMMRRAFSVRSGSNGYGRIHDTRDEDDEGLQRRAAATVGFEKERKKKKKRDAGRRIVGACKRFLGITSNKL